MLLRIKLTLDYDKLDQWGLPTVTFDAIIRENELNMRKDMQIQAMEMLDNASLYTLGTFPSFPEKESFQICFFACF